MSSIYTGKFFVRNPSKYLQRKCGTKQFRRFEIEFWGFENEFPHFQMQFFTTFLICVTTILFKAAYKSGPICQNTFSPHLVKQRYGHF